MLPDLWRGSINLNGGSVEMEGKWHWEVPHLECFVRFLDDRKHGHVAASPVFSLCHYGGFFVQNPCAAVRCQSTQRLLLWKPRGHL